MRAGALELKRDLTAIEAMGRRKATATQPQAQGTADKGPTGDEACSAHGSSHETRRASRKKARVAREPIRFSFNSGPSAAPSSLVVADGGTVFTLLAAGSAVPAMTGINTTPKSCLFSIFVRFDVAQVFRPALQVHPRMIRPIDF